MKKDFFNTKGFLTLLFVLVFVSHVIVLAGNQPKDSVVAQVGTKKITIKEFYERSELTIRPPKFKNKNTTLNNLISEKILALEAEKDSSVHKNNILQAKVKGIKEQVMRDKLFEEEANKKATFDIHELQKNYNVSKREYELEFYRITNRELALKIEAIIDSVPRFTNEMLNELQAKVGKKPIQKINFKDPNDDAIIEALYTNPVDTGTVIGPLKLTNGDYLVMKVLKWTDYPIIGGQEQIQQWNKVKQKFQQIKARKIWLGYQNQIFADKKIEFEENAFNALSDYAFEYFNRNSQADSFKNSLGEIPIPEPSLDPSVHFFSLDNKIYTVDDFKNEILAHPLVYRTKYLDKNNFKKHFRLAVVDLMRDRYLAEEAYKKSFDLTGEVIERVNMWKDSFLSVYQQQNYINQALKNGIINRSDNLGMLKYWQNYVVELQKKYYGSVKVNLDALSKIELTNIDYIALRSGVPYPVATPNFPIIIQSENLDYTKKK